MAHNTCSVSAAVDDLSLTASVAYLALTVTVVWAVEDTPLPRKRWSSSRRLLPQVERGRTGNDGKSWGSPQLIPLRAMAKFPCSALSSFTKGSWLGIVLKSVTLPNYCDYLNDKQNQESGVQSHVVWDKHRDLPGHLWVALGVLTPLWEASVGYHTMEGTVRTSGPAPRWTPCCLICKSKYNVNKATGRPGWRKWDMRKLDKTRRDYGMGRGGKLVRGQVLLHATNRLVTKKWHSLSKWQIVARDFSFETEIFQKEAILCQSRSLCLYLSSGSTWVKRCGSTRGWDLRRG